MSAADLLPLVDGLAAGLADLRGRLAALAEQDGLPSGAIPAGGAGVPGGAPGPVSSGPAGVPAGGTTGSPATAAKPSGSRSGLPWASIWRHPSSSTGIVKPAFESFEAYRGRKLDGLHVFVQGWKGRPIEQWPANSWTTAKASAPGGLGEGVLWWLGRDGIPAFLTWPLLSDIAPPGKDRFVALARGDYDAAHRAVAAQVRATGAPVATVRLGHEINMGDPASVYDASGVALPGSPVNYPWSLAYAAGDFALVAAGWTRIANLLRAELPGVLIDLNCLRRLDQPCTYGKKFDDVFGSFLPAADIVSGEGYLTQDIPDDATRAAKVADFMAGGTAAHPTGPAGWASCALTHGKLTAVPEWGPAVPPGKAAVRDVPEYVAAMAAFYARWAPFLAYESNFSPDDLAGTGAHSLWNPVSVPWCSAAYRAAWAPPTISPVWSPP